MATLPISSTKAADTSVVIEGLQALLSATISLTMTTQSAHWSVVGSDFFELHGAFGGQYDSLFDSQDVLAERIRALKGFPRAELGGPVLNPPFSAKEAASAVLAGREKAIESFQKVANMSRQAGDTVTENMLLAMIEEHQKVAWMLRSYLG